MTDDEAVIHAILGAQGDDAPRLIYADWLDERGARIQSVSIPFVNWSQNMHCEELRAVIKAQPFVPFTIYLPEGREVRIVYHDFALLSPDGRTLWAYQPDRSCDMIDVMLIPSIHLDPPQEPIMPAVNGKSVA